MEQIPVCLVGCGGMGHRHVMAHQVFRESGLCNLDLVAVCDIRRENAERVAGEAERLLGRRPLVFTDLEDVLAHPDILAVDVVTDVSTHHQIAVAALQAGKHTLVEKPLGLTVRACQAIIAAAEQSGAVLATAENYRRDPPYRLARAIIEHGLLGDPYLMIHTSLGGSDIMAATPWRHLKEKGAIGLDMGVHYADVIRYFLGEYATIFGQGLIVEPERRRPAHEDHPFISYREMVRTYPETITATGEDAAIALFRMQTGALVQFALVTAGRGSHRFECSVHGRWGAIDVPRERFGGPVVLRLEDRELRGREILALLPDFALDEITARLFGSQGVTYEPPADAPHAPFIVDFKHLAIEFYDFGEAILKNRPPEVDGYGGMVAVAAILGIYESGVAGRAVTMEEVLAGQVRAYQAEVDAALGLA